MKLELDPKQKTHLNCIGQTFVWHQDKILREDICTLTCPFYVLCSLYEINLDKLTNDNEKKGNQWQEITSS